MGTYRIRSVTINGCELEKLKNLLAFPVQSKITAIGIVERVKLLKRSAEDAAERELRGPSVGLVRRSQTKEEVR